MNTIFITSFHALISRNILCTNIVGLLLKADFEIVIFCPKAKLVFFQKEFSHYGRSVRIIGISSNPTKMEFFLQRLALSAVRTHSLDIKRLTELHGKGRFLSILLSNRIGRAIVRYLNNVFTPRNTFKEYFDIYKPALVFATDIQHFCDIRLIEDAKEYNIPSIGMVRSWDNPTAKGLIRVIPNKLLVHNELLKKEVIKYHGIKKSRIIPVGIPHYDKYLQGAKIARQDFMRSFGAGPEKKLVLYIPTGDRYVEKNNLDCDIINMLQEILGNSAHILVRCPPADTVQCLDNTLYNAGITIDRIQKNDFETIKHVEIGSKDDERLMNSLNFADLVITGPSTVCIDAALFDKPIILIGFDGAETRDYYSSIRRYYDYDHFKPILESGGVILAKNALQFKQAVLEYLSNPRLHAKGREQLIECEAGTLDAMASVRVVDNIKSVL